MTGAIRPGRNARVLAIHRYYWPDTPPYASILRSILREWSEMGHDVSVLTSQPSYKPELGLSERPRREVIDGVTVRRVPMRPDRSGSVTRLFNAVWFPLAVALRILLGRRQDVVMCSTVPPVLLGFAASFAARVRRARFIYHCMDLHPEIGALSGEFSSPWLYRLLMRMDVATCRRSDAIVVLSDDMRESLLARDRTLASRIVVLNNFELPTFDEPRVVADQPGTHDRFRIAFTGNVGRFQGLEAIVRAALVDDDRLKPLQFVLMGEGAAKAGLEGLIDDSQASGRVVLLPHSSAAEAKALLRTADMGVVSLTPGVVNFAYPSKTATYLSEGLPVLAAVEPESELARMVRGQRLGGVLDVSDHEALVDSLASWVSRRPEVRNMREHALRAWRERFAATALLPRWKELLNDVLSTSPATQSGQPRSAA